MKKALLAIVLAVAALVPVGIGASTPASAVTCGAAQWKYGSGLTTDFYDGDGTPSFFIQGAVRFKVCGTGGGQYAQVMQYNVSWQRNGSCGSVKFRIDPNVIGTVNPAGRTVACTGSANVTVAWALSTKVYASQASNLRCLGAVMTAVYTPGFDQPVDVPTVCII